MFCDLMGLLFSNLQEGISKVLVNYAQYLPRWKTELKPDNDVQRPYNEYSETTPRPLLGGIWGVNSPLYNFKKYIHNGKFRKKHFCFSFQISFCGSRTFAITRCILWALVPKMHLNAFVDIMGRFAVNEKRWKKRRIQSRVK